MQRRTGMWRVFIVVALCGVMPVHADESPTTPYVQPADVKAWLDEGRAVTFLDVRDPDEFAAAHLPGARNISWRDVLTITSELPTDQPIVLYCIHSSHRAPEAARRLRAAGFENAHVLEGGIVAWEAGGLTIRAADLARAPTIMPVTDRCAELTKGGP